MANMQENGGKVVGRNYVVHSGLLPVHCAAMNAISSRQLCTGHGDACNGSVGSKNGLGSLRSLPRVSCGFEIFRNMIKDRAGHSQSFRLAV